MTRKVLTWSLLPLGTAVLLGVYNLAEGRNHNNSLNARIEQIIGIGKHSEVSCAEVAATRPLVLLALGQSNAGNHGSPSVTNMSPVILIADGKCIKATDPLPGGTGRGGSIWQRLPQSLARETASRPIVMSILAVEATSIDDWTSASSPLKQRLVEQVGMMRQIGLPPDLVLWQQGEADSLEGTSKERYLLGLATLASALTGAQSNAPILLARSTICRSPPNAAVRGAIESIVLGDPHFRLGPDTDTLNGDRFRNGCHLTVEGLDSAARMWGKTIELESSAVNSVD